MDRLAYPGLFTLTLVSVAAAVILLSPAVAHSQDPEWMSFTSGANVWALADDGDYLWVGGDGGLTRLNKATGERTFYNPANSGLPDNEVHALVIDSQGNLWIGTGGGLAVYREGGVLLPGVTAVGEELEPEIPAAFSLSQNYPNPFNPSTEIAFTIPRRAWVKISVYNVLGQFVCELTNGEYMPGVYHLQWDGRDSANIPVSSGVYFYRMTTAAGAVTTKRMMVLR